MGSALEFLAMKHSQILREKDYNMACWVIADYIADLLTIEKKPYIMKVHKEQMDPRGFLDSRAFFPLVLKEYNVFFRAHYVCCAGDEAFDPLVGKPVPNSIYTQTVFGENLPMDVEVPHKKILDSIRSSRFLMGDYLAVNNVTALNS